MPNKCSTLLTWIHSKLSRIKRVNLIRVSVIIFALVSGAFLITAWHTQFTAPLSCSSSLDKLADHNGYIQINVKTPHVIEEYFEGEAFLYYASHESPPKALRLVIEAQGQYASSLRETQLFPWSRGLATPKPILFTIPTPGVSRKLFPFDSPKFDLSIQFTPPNRPKVVIVRNLTNEFIPSCSSFISTWDGIDKLNVKLDFRRNPYVQVTVVIIGLCALVFGLLLGFINKIQDLALSTASYFFSIWSMRGIIAPSSFAYPTILDFWLTIMSIMVLLIIVWRLSYPQKK